MLKNLKVFLFRVFCRLYSSTHKIEKKICFDSFGGRTYSDNPRAVSEQLHRQFPDYSIVWWLKGDNELIVPDYIKQVHSYFEYIKEMCTSCAVVRNNDYVPTMIKRKKQVFIQCWHGDRGFKKILLDQLDDCEKKNKALYDAKVVDAAIAGSKFGVMQFRSAFKYDGEILEVGTPRNDKLIKNDVAEKQIIKGNLNIPDDAYVILYAPTFRDNVKQLSSDSIDFKKLCDMLYKKIKKPIVCLFRTHPLFSSSFKSIEGVDIIDVSKYQDMADLLLISDILITDYSSSAGDFPLTRKPVFLFQPDKNEYESLDRTFYFDIKESPFLVAEDGESLISLIKDFDESTSEDYCNKILLFYKTKETGKASEIICDYINKKYLDNHC